MPLLRGILLLLILATAWAATKDDKLVTQLFSDDNCKTLISSPLPRSSGACVSDLFSGTNYQTTADTVSGLFSVILGCDSACEGCSSVVNITASECGTYGTGSVRVEVPMMNQTLNATLYSSDACTSAAEGYGNQILKSGLCTAATSDGLFVTIIELATPEVIFALACSADCNSCGFYGRAPVGQCISLSLPQFFGKVSLVSAAGALTLPVLLLAAAMLFTL